MNVTVLGLGAWGQDFRSWQDLTVLLDGGKLEHDGARAPKPEIIPANERRRAPLSVKLAVESSWQATQMSGLDPANLRSVFVSGLGDTDLTDYMCKTLASERKALSPTKFHNSVHNAAAGYWTISTACMQAANSVAGFQESVSLTLLEAIIQCQSEQQPMLLTFYDAPVAPLLQGMLKNQHAFAMSLIIAPTLKNELNTPKNISNPMFSAEVVQTATAWPSLDASDELRECYENNPAAKVLALAKLLHTGSDSITMPLSKATALRLSVAR
jgi:hypothetical protein